MGSLDHAARRRNWRQLDLAEKRKRLKVELLEEMVTMAQQLELQLSVDQILRAIEQTEYTAEEIEEQHRFHCSWSKTGASQSAGQ